MKINLYKNCIYSFKGKNGNNIPEGSNVLRNPMSAHKTEDFDTFTKTSSPLYDTTEKTMANIQEDIKIPDEYTEEEYLQACMDCNIRDMATRGFNKRVASDLSLEYFFQIVYKNNLTDFLVSSLKNSGIITVGDFRAFLDHISKLPDALTTNIHDFVDIYPKINDKKDIENFPETLLMSNAACKYFEEENDINANAEFIKKMGYSDEIKFYSAYHSLYADSFDDFSSSADRYIFLKYIQGEYDERFEFFRQITDPESKKKDKDLRKEYNKQHIVIDYLSETEGNKWVFDFLKIYKPLAQINSLSRDAKNTLNSSSFGNIFQIDKYIKFLKFLNKENITPKEVNCYVCNNFTQDIEIDTILKNKNQIIQKLKECGASDEKALEFYKNHKNLLNTCFKKDEDFASDNGILSAVDVIKKFNIKDDKAFLAFYNKVTNKHSNKYPKEDIIDFVSALSFLNDEDIKKCNKNKNLNVLKEAKKKQALFETLDENFRNYIAEDGTRAFDIYKKTNDTNKTREVIQNLMYNLSVKEGELFQRLLPYFKTPEEAGDFIKNNINSGANGNYDDFGKYCINVIKTLSTTEADDYVKKLNDSNFIKNSKHEMPRIMELYNSPEDISLFYTTVLDKKINSAKPILDFIENFQDKNGETKNILKHLSSQSEITFDEYEKYINHIQNIFEKYNIPVKIDNSNIMNLPIYTKEIFSDEFEKKEGSYVTAFANLLVGTYDTPVNFISKFGDIYDAKNPHIGKLRVANEICRYMQKESENYSSLLEKLFPDTDKKTMNKYFEKPELLARDLPKEFMDFINNDKCFKMDDKPLGMSLHAKMRIIERYITNEGNGFDTLDYEKMSKRISDVCDVIYHSKPFKIAQAAKENYFKCYFKHEDSPTGETKAVFSKNGKLITIAPARR